MQSENKMGTLPINKLLLGMSLPMMLSMLVQALYNIVDSVFVAQLSEDALTAVSLAFPAQNIMIAVAAGTGVGVNALLSRSLGEKNFQQANKVANNSVFLALVGYALFAVFGTLAVSPFYTFQTDNPAIYEDGIAYLRLCMICSFGIFGQISLEKLLQATGRTMYSMVSQIAGAVTNIILDPIMIFGYFGFPAMGVTGAALATVIGQIFGTGLALYFNMRKNPDIQLRIAEMRPDAATIKRVYAVGAPSIIMQSIGSVMVFGLNKILMAFTSTATAVFGVYFKLQSFVFLPIFGLNNGMVPIVAYNYGARKPERMKMTIRLAIIYASAIMAAGTLVFWFFTPQLLSLFRASKYMIEIGVPALRTISIGFIFAGFCIITLSVCQALGHGVLGLISSLVRQIIVLLPAAYVLAQFGSVHIVWYAFPLGDLAALTLCILFLRRMITTEIQPLAKH